MPADSLKYFRAEAKELLEGLSQGILSIERGQGNAELLAKMLRFAHTLKGASRVVKQSSIGQLAHEVEDALAAARSDLSLCTKEWRSSVFKKLDSISDQVAKLEAPGPKPVPTAPGSDLVETTRVDLSELDVVIQGGYIASIRLSELRGQLEELERTRQLSAELSEQLNPQRARNTPQAFASAEELRRKLEVLSRGLSVGLDTVESELVQVRDTAQRLRLLPANTIFDALERSARDAASLLDKQINFRASGGEHRLDSHVLALAREALLHAVRNAVAHGIEPAAERSALGKPPAGNIEISVERKGGRVLFTCRDDGHGIDLIAVRKMTVARGLKTPQAAAALTLSEAAQILMKGGVTTQSSADEVSGRGIGLDAVVAAAHRLKGNVRFDSQPGKGTALELSAPVSLSSNLAILVETGDTVASIPLESVKCAIRLQPNDVSRAPEGSSIVYQGQVIPYAPLHKMLGLKRGTSDEPGPRTALILQGNNSLGAVAVDRLIGTSHVVVRQLPEAATAQPILAGVSLDAQGNPQLALDPDILVQSSLSAFPYEAAAEKAVVAPILVVDDSLTTRMLEQSILESAGYAVELATSAEEALEKAREKPHALFIVDVEMPGMSGFDFVARTQTDERLKNTPAVLVTSRNAPEDFERGKQAGASAYIVKGEFDQGYLLDTIRTLLGGEVR